LDRCRPSIRRRRAACAGYVHPRADLFSSRYGAVRAATRRTRNEVISLHFAGPLTSDAFRQLAREGLITPKVNVVHGNGMDDDELRVLIDYGATFTITPEIEMQMGFSLCITGRLLAGGARPSLGVDTETSSSSEIFQVMRFAMQLQRYLDHQSAWQGAGAPMAVVSVSAREVLRWATAEGARAAGLDGEIGALAPGKRADIILIRVPKIAPAIGPAQVIVSRAMKSDVDAVMIAGQRKISGERLGTAASELDIRLAEISRRVRRVPPPEVAP
jgi:5-methylthioadenosine/S-adenosylhomocysteine deaminase